MTARLTWWRRAALAVLWAEYAARVAWAPLAVLAGAIGIALLGLVPGGAIAPTLFLAATLAAAAFCLRAGLRGQPRPSLATAEARLERDSALPHRPFMVLADRPAALAGHPGLWSLHFARAEAALARLRLRTPAPGLPAHDPAALRFLSLMLLTAGVAVAGADALPRLRAAFLPGFGAGTAVTVTLQGWVEPPAYTGLAPILLPHDGGTVQVPQGSRLNVSLTGGRFKPHLSTADGAAKFHTLGPGSWQASTILHHSGTLSVSRFFDRVGAWDIDVLPNEPPTVNWSGVPGQAGKSLELALPWHVAQRWGVNGLHAHLVPDGHPNLAPIDVTIPLPGTPRDATGTMRTDLSANPLAGTRMEARLIARDVSGQTSESAPAHITLPAREFHNGLARAIIELRRRVALGDERPLEAAADIDALAQSPRDAASLAGQSGLYLNLVSVGALLRDNASPPGIADAQARLWIVALALDGALPEPSEKALDHARDSLRRALDQRAQGKQNESYVDHEIRRLAEALQRRLNDMARKAVKEGKMPPFDPHQSFHMPSLDKLMQEMQQAEQRGDHEEAKRKLAQIENLLNKLRDAKVLTPQQAQQAEQANKQAKEQAGAVQDMVQREAGLMDNAQHRAPRPPPLAPGYNPEGMAPPPDTDQLEANEELRGADARTQRALSRALDAVKGGFGASGGKVPPAMDDATRDMAAATGALTAGQEGAARQAEARAIADLQKGGKSMSDQMAANSQMAIVPGSGQPGEEGEEMGQGPGGQEEGGERDPLGRLVHQGTGGKAEDDGSVKVPDEMEAARSRAIQEELRRREGDRARGTRGAGLYWAVVEAVLSGLQAGEELGGMCHSPQTPRRYFGPDWFCWRGADDSFWCLT